MSLKKHIYMLLSSLLPLGFVISTFILALASLFLSFITVLMKGFNAINGTLHNQQEKKIRIYYEEKNSRNPAGIHFEKYNS